jgi:hypothetical protein
MIWTCKDLSNSDDAKAYVWVFKTRMQALETYHKHRKAQGDDNSLLSKLSTPNKIKRLPERFEVVNTFPGGVYYIRCPIPVKRKRHGRIVVARR